MALKSICKRGFVFLLGVFMIVSMSGCTQSQGDDTLSVMIPLQKDSFVDFFSLFQEQNEDVQFDMSAYRGGSVSAYLLQRFENNDLTDIVITSYAPSGEIQEDTLLDLSGYDFVHNYKESVLTNLEVDGKVYLLEGPNSVRGIAYNKTMFEEHGWEEPESHEEFIALLQQIQNESDVMPMGIQGKYPGTYFTIMSELSHCDFLHTPAGAQWMQDFANGEATSLEGFGTGLQLLQDWLNAGAFVPEQLTMGDSDIYEMFTSRGCAMAYVMGSQNKLVELAEATDDEYSIFPIYGEGEDSAFVATTYGLKLGLNKELGEPGNEAKLEKALKVMEFLSSEEGQMVFHTGRGDILPILGSDAGLSDMFDEVSEVMENGHSAPFLYPGYEDILAPAGEYLRDACYNGGDLTGVFDLMDRLRKDTLNNKDNYLASVEETLDEDETAQFVANVLQAQGYGDFALVSQGKYSEYFDLAGGANGKLYKGGITALDINIPVTNMNAQNCVTMTLSGSQVKAALEEGRILSDDEGHEDSYVYFASGIDVERDEDGKVTSIMFQGKELDDEETYTVAFTPEDYGEALAALGNPTETGIAWADAYRSYIVELGNITSKDAQ